jgi:hypothetical protein
MARCLLALLCGAQGVGTLVIDLNRTHAANPRWTGHPRFHLVWQAVSYALLSLLEVALILMPGPLPNKRFYLAAILAGIPMLSFMAAFFSRKIYGGTLINPNGIPPMKMKWFDSEIQIDLNLATEVTALLMLMATVALFRH